MTTKHHAHTLQPSPTPTPGHTTSAAMGWTLAGIFMLAVPVLFIGFWVAVIRFVWKRASRPAVQKGE